MNIIKFVKALVLIFISMQVFAVKADVLGFVEKQSIGLVTTHAVSPDGKFIYSTTITPIKVFVHSRDPETGEILAEVQSLEAKDFNSGVADPSFFPESIVVSPDSKQVYIAAHFGDSGNSTLNFDASVLRFDVDTSGALTYNKRIIVTGDSEGLTISKSGKFMFVGDGVNGNRLSAILRAPNGNITTVQTNVITPSDGSGGAAALVISSDEKNLYGSSLAFDGHLHVYNINQDDGKLSLIQSFIPEGNDDYSVPGDIVGLGSGGSGSALSDDGKYFYTVGGRGDDQGSISIFSRNTDGLLTFIKNVSGTIGQRRLLFAADSKLVISRDQKFVYTYDGIEDNISVWRRNESTGDLSYIGTIEENSEIKFDGAGEELILSEDGKNLYLNNGSGILVFDLRADLSVVKTDAIDPVNTSGTIDYTLAITNNGPSDAQNVTISDSLPSGTSFISGSVNSTTGSCSASGQTVTCTMGQMFANDGFNAAIKVNAPSTEGQITNTATVTADQLDTKTANNTDTETTNIGSNGGTTTPTTPTTGTSGGGGTIPLNFLIVIFSFFILRRRHN